MTSPYFRRTSATATSAGAAPSATRARRSPSADGRPRTPSVPTHRPGCCSTSAGGSAAWSAASPSTTTCPAALPAAPRPAAAAVPAAGRQVAAAPPVRAGDPPRTLCADLSGARRLELLVRTSRWEYCHAVWLDPVVDDEPADALAGPWRDCL